MIVKQIAAGKGMRSVRTETGNEKEAEGKCFIVTLSMRQGPDEVKGGAQFPEEIIDRSE